MVDHTEAAHQGLAALHQFVVDDGTFAETLRHIAELACLVAPADMTGIALLIEGRAATEIFTDPVIADVDQRQYSSGSGPCLDTLRHTRINRIDSTDDDVRWPEFCLSAAAHGVHSTLSVPIATRDRSLGALNLYSHRPDAFNDDTITALAPFVLQSAIVLANSRLYWDGQDLTGTLHQALKSRECINYAVGILMAGGAPNPDEAFQLLVQASQRENRKVRVIAAEIVDRATHRPAPTGATHPATTVEETR